MTATFVELPPVTVTFAAPANGSYTVNGETVSAQLVKANQTPPYSVTLVATPAADFRFAGWYMLEDGAKKIFSTDVSVTKQFEESATVGAEFIPAGLPIYAAVAGKGYDNLYDALSEARAGEALSVNSNVTLSQSAGVAAGVTLTIASGVTITVASGATLYVDGTVSNNGTISGTVSRCTKLISQVGQSEGVPFNPYGDVKYWKTSITTPSIAAISGAGSHTTIVNGLGETVYRGANYAAFVCSINKSVAINHITGVVSGQSSFSNAYTAANKSTQLILLTANGTHALGSSTNMGDSITVDAAGNDVKITAKQVNSGVSTYLNANSATSPRITNARVVFINCKTTSATNSDTLNANQASYTSAIHIYDCAALPTLSGGGNATMTAALSGVCIFSGGPYSPSWNSNYHVYGGKFSKDPTNYLASNDLEAPKEGNYWVVRKIVPTVNVAKVGTTEYESLQEAVNAAASSGGTVILLPGIAEIELDTPITVASGKTLTIDLAGYAITAPNGAIVNNGTLYLQDTSTFDVPGSITTSSGNLIVNNGTMDVTYGKYTGSILLNSGTFTTHGGVFVGTISVASGADPKVVSDFRGGEFSQSMADFLRDGYTEVYCNPVSSEPKRYWVGQFPTPLVATSSLSDAEKAWKLDFLSSSDLTIYKKTTARSSHSSLADWQRRAELNSSIVPWSGYVLDCGLVFDRPVASGSVTFYGKVQITMSQEIDRNLAANEDRGVLAHGIYESNYTPLSYGRSIDEVGSITAGVKNNANANVGTVCTVDLRVCTQSKNTVGEYDKLQALVDVRYMLGGKKAAIDRGANRLAYDSLTAAVAAVQDGERILIGADCSENVTLPGVGTFTIDHYGFAFTGAVSAPDGLMISSATEVQSAAVAQDVTSSHAVTYVVVPEGVAAIGGHGYATLASAVDSLADGDEVTLLGDCGESVSVSKVCHFTFDTNGKAYTGQLSAGQGYSLATGVAANGKMDCVVVRGVLSVESATGATLGVSGPEEIPAGYSVSYRVGDGAASNSPVISLPESGCRTNVVKAVLTKDGSSAELTAIKSVGVLKVESVSETTAIAVPWYAFGDGGTSVKADSLIYLGNRSAGDELKVYTGSGYEAWELVEVGGVKTWTPIKTVKDGGISVAGAAGNTCVVRGQGLLLTRCDTAAPIYLVGSADGTGTRTTVLAKGTSLVSPPSLSGCDLNAAFPNPGDDAITVQDATGAPKRYTWKNGAWTCDGDGTGLVVPAGTGFIYDNKSDADKSVEW